MPKVVSNTTPLISLLKISRLSILKELYGEIIIAQGVFQEIEVGKQKEYYIDLSELPWIKIEKINDEKALSYLLDLDKGEAETIILANELKADLVIMDESLGRFHARHANLKITGTLGVLLKAKKLGFISEIDSLLKELRSKGVWISDELMQHVLNLSNEK